MLAPDLIGLIRSAIEGELAPRIHDVAMEVQASDRHWAVHGRGGKNVYDRAQIGRAQIGSEELANRAQIIWNQIQRCHAAFGAPTDEQTSIELQQLIAEHITAQVAPITSIVAMRGTGFPHNAVKIIPDTIDRRCDELIQKFTNDVKIHMQAPRQAPANSGARITVQGNVGAIQTGDYATAHITVNASVGPRLIEALEQLRIAIERAVGMTDNQRNDSIEIIGDLVSAARAEKPNGPKILGLLNGLAVTVQSVASIRCAWEFVQDAAKLMGIS